MAHQANGKHQLIDDPPRATIMTSGQEHKQPSAITQQPLLRHQFPPAFNLYQESSFSQRRFTLGEHQATPLYAVTVHSGWSGKPKVILHSGPTDTSPPLAAIDNEIFGCGSPPEVMPPSRNRPFAQRLHDSSGLGFATFTFSCQTAMVTGGQRIETYQWRHSRGNEVKALGGHGSGWKLVRVAPDAPAPSGATFASDGREVVAAFAWASGSLTKKIKFRFLGSGESGNLGERWAVMAVATALKIWARERRQRQVAPVSAGGGGA
ncbi:hypothetical protein GGR53DRAFT_459519 [Hypoxylon sp. FL1150]|nr:hypothetical protein GGR53DRAFT_459519 [Hypoxylon sp. FL1150]